MIENAIEYVKQIFVNDCSGHDYHHTMRVYRLAVQNVKQENAVDFMESNGVDNEIIETVCKIIVDYDIPDEYQIILMKRVTPFEILEPGHNFEEHVITHMQSENKYKVITSWQDKDGNDFNNEQLKAW